MTLNRILAVVHLWLALLYFTFVLFGKWAKRGDPDEGVFSADGGTGFGYVAVAIGVILVVLALMRLAGKHRVLPGLGVEQLTIVLGLAAVANLLGFVVGWLAVFPAGTGWAIPFAYFPASFIPQIGFLTLSATEPEAGIRPISPGQRRAMSIIALVGGVAVAALPLLTWISSGSVSLAGYDGRSGNPTSGPRLSYILLIVGFVIVIAAFMRLRPQGLAEAGANMLHSQCLFAGALVAFLLPLATLIAIMQQDLSPTLEAGVGLWLGLAVGVVLLASSFWETRQRGAAGV